MTTAADALKDFITPLLTGWRVQFGRWHDDQQRPNRFAVIRPAGGANAELLRRPQFTLTLIGSANDPVSVAADAAETIVQAMRVGSGSLIYLTSGEPAYFPTDDGRPVFELAISTITD